METKEVKNGKANNEKSTVKNLPSAKKEVKETLKETPKVEEVKKETEAKEKNIASQVRTISEVLNPTAKVRISRLETMNILADKFKSVSSKYDELTNFMAGNDSTNAQMKFSSASNYSFTLNNPVIINKVLLLVEAEFSAVVENAEKEVTAFQI